MTAHVLETASALLPAPAAPPGQPFRPGDMAVLVARASWEGEGSPKWPTREELEKALDGKASVLAEPGPAADDQVPLAASAGAAQEARAWPVQILLPPGDHELPALPFSLVAADGSELESAEIPGPAATVATVLDEASDAALQQAQANPEELKAEVAQQLAPARGPWELAPRIPWWAWLILALLVLALAALAAWRFGRRRRVAVVPPPPLEAPEVVARRRLRELREGALLSTGRHLEFHVALADTVKEYLERRLGTDLRERTTDEIRRLFAGPLRSVRHAAEARHEALAILDACDMVKFAKVLPMPSEALSLIDGAERLVTKTTEAAPAAAQAGGGSKEAA